MWRIVTAIAVCLIASCTRSIKKDEDVLENPFGGYEQARNAVNPNLGQLRDTMQAFSNESTALDHGTLAVTLDAIAQALRGIPYAEVTEEATEVHRIAAVLRTMGPNTVQRTEMVRDALDTVVKALENASLDAHYGAQRSLIADLAQQVATLDPVRPVSKQAVAVKLALCDTANAIAVMPSDNVSALPCTGSPTASAARDLTNERLAR